MLEREFGTKSSSKFGSAIASNQKLSPSRVLSLHIYHRQETVKSLPSWVYTTSSISSWREVKFALLVLNSTQHLLETVENSVENLDSVCVPLPCRFPFKVSSFLELNLNLPPPSFSSTHFRITPWS